MSEQTPIISSDTVTARKRARSAESQDLAPPAKHAHRGILLLNVSSDRQAAEDPMLWEPDARDTDEANAAVRAAFEQIHGSDYHLQRAVERFCCQRPSASAPAFDNVLPLLKEKTVRLVSLYTVKHTTCPRRRDRVRELRGL